MKPGKSLTFIWTSLALGWVTPAEPQAVERAQASPVSSEWQRPDLEVHEHTLENGLRLFILPRPGVPIASFVVQYRIGGVNESLGAVCCCGDDHFIFERVRCILLRRVAEIKILNELTISLTAKEDILSIKTLCAFPRILDSFDRNHIIATIIHGRCNC